MPPATLCAAIERIRAGEPRETALAGFLDAFYLTEDREARFAMLEPEPPRTGDERLDALAAAIAGYLARQWMLGRLPAWISGPGRKLKEPWFTTTSDDPAMKEYLAHTSPAEFRNHNIFTESRPLRRARMPGPATE